MSSQRSGLLAPLMACWPVFLSDHRPSAPQPDPHCAPKDLPLLTFGALLAWLLPPSALSSSSPGPAERPRAIPHGKCSSGSRAPHSTPRGGNSPGETEQLRRVCTAGRWAELTPALVCLLPEALLVSLAGLESPATAIPGPQQPSLRTPCHPSTPRVLVPSPVLCAHGGLAGEPVDRSREWGDLTLPSWPVPRLAEQSQALQQAGPRLEHNGWGSSPEAPKPLSL